MLPEAAHANIHPMLSGETFRTDTEGEATIIDGQYCTDIRWTIVHLELYAQRFFLFGGRNRAKTAKVVFVRISFRSMIARKLREEFHDTESSEVKDAA
jgi:hypothetical protein